MEVGYPFLRDVFSDPLYRVHTHMYSLSATVGPFLTDCFSWWCVYYVSLSATTLSCDFSWLLSPTGLWGSLCISWIGWWVSHCVSWCLTRVLLCVPGALVFAGASDTRVTKCLGSFLGTPLSIWERQPVNTLGQSYCILTNLTG